MSVSGIIRVKQYEHMSNLLSVKCKSIKAFSEKYENRAGTT
jgi:hypothetical protein